MNFSCKKPRNILHYRFRDETEKNNSFTIAVSYSGSSTAGQKSSAEVLLSSMDLKAVLPDKEKLLASTEESEE
ncbi:hypothetical protein TSYNTROOL_01100 [Tepidanaerobacter syntrophicus]|uniref:hypothetical protein n=1 Tax=Tepidanaerobacter syntrophicus TaxID=224999 RepID=UPI0022EE8DCE|nr:hypothetical protein [Tepidanaerobacter syntrophicus]GLI50024.1 hypothetical protein TSYNTROOL_01100 [Tepidanaerobacter syntrophicus]